MNLCDAIEKYSKEGQYDKIFVTAGISHFTENQNLREMLESEEMIPYCKLVPKESIQGKKNRLLYSKLLLSENVNHLTAVDQIMESK